MDELNLDGILDEALRIDERESAKDDSQPKSELKDELEATKESDEHPLSGTLEEVLGFDSDSGATDQPFPAGSPAAAGTFGNDSSTVLDNHFNALTTNPPAGERAAITDPARTRLADSLPDFAPQKNPLESTSPNVQAPTVNVQVDAIGGAKEPKKVVVPIRVSIDRDTDEIRLDLSLDIKIVRKD